ncbi:unnamed protein product [[Candida] boidinii]|uniref:Unnamed protein product n=1 Tax=Candida boidinii TaxID=5477 RepID=A0A9W6WFS1_CANBO|nr:unnamed protein product [[Candida] boidinii]
MTQVYPISCIECRRRKIKCNKINPCNQCVKKGIECEYPAKFRSIEINELIEEDALKVPANLIKNLSTNRKNSSNNNNATQIKIEDNFGLAVNKSKTDSPISTSDNNMKIPLPSSITIPKEKESTEISFTNVNSKKNRVKDEKIPNQQGEIASKKRDVTKLESTDDILLALKKENETLKLKLKDMKLRTRQARIENKLNSSSYIRKFISNENNEVIGGISNHDLDKNNERYYGPNSTQFMISNTNSDKIHLNDFDNFMKVKRQIRQKRNLPLLLVERNTPASTPDSNSPASLLSSSSDSANNQDQTINNNTTTTTTRERDNSSPQSSTSNNNMNKKQINKSLANSKENIDLIIKVVKRFSHLRNYYSTFIDMNKVIKFLNNYNNIKEWNNDDDLLLIITIIITTLRSLPENDKLITDNKLNFLALREPLYKQYRNLKNGIRTDTLTCLQSFILECEDLFYCDFIEKSWNLLFRIVCSSYSLGLHVYDKSIIEVLKNVDTSSSNNNESNNNSSKKKGSINGSIANAPMMGFTNNISPINLAEKHPRAAVWFVINFLSATLCSVLGRPNPVTFSFSPLLKNYQIRLNYKIAISELIKRSTNMLIESYKIDIDYKLVCNIDEEFVNEAIVYEKILSDTRALRVSRSRDKTKPCQITLPVMEPSYRSNKKSNNNGSSASNTTNTNDNNNNYSAPMRSLSHIRLSELLNDCPLDIRFPILVPCKICKENDENCLITSDGDTLSDLILIYGNRAKFHQHFMNENDQSKLACIDSISTLFIHFFIHLRIRH